VRCYSNPALCNEDLCKYYRIARRVASVTYL